MKYAQEPTHSWGCRKCGNRVDRFRGDREIRCRCGAWYSTSGQRLRDDWQNNPSVYDDGIGDLEGYEIQHHADD